MRAWVVYIVRCSNNALYTGITNNLKERILKHNAGTGAKYTRSHRPVALVWSRVVRSSNQALRLEAKIKTWDKKTKEDFIKT